MNIDPFDVKWSAIEGSIFTLAEYPIACPFNAEIFNGKTIGENPRTVPIAIAYNVGEKMARYIARLHNDKLKMENING